MLRATFNNKNKCPICNSDKLDYTGEDYDVGTWFTQDWFCEYCGATGTECFDLVFRKHKHIQDEDNNPVDEYKTKDKACHNCGYEVSYGFKGKKCPACKVDRQ